MANRIRRIVSKAKDDARTVLSIGAQWEYTRADYWLRCNQPDKADECFSKAQVYELELQEFLERAQAG